MKRRYEAVYRARRKAGLSAPLSMTKSAQFARLYRRRVLW
jgi:hypothetical protein